MTAVQNARDAALETLLQTSRGGWSDGSLKRTVQRAGLDSRDAALCSRLVYGVVQNRALLDYYIDHWCTQRANHLEPVVAYVLRLGVYQILFMDKIPERAAVNEAVEQIKRWGRPRAAGMVNAVLRKCVASKNALPPLRGKDDAALLSLQYSHPRWLVERLIKLLGRGETEQLLALHNQPVPTVIQTNPLKTTPAALRQELEAAGAEVTPHPWLEGCFTVTGTGDLEKLPAFTEGRCTVQDAAARLVSLAAAPDQHARVLDVCAAPGGKSFALAMDMADGGDILSCDVHPHKLKLIESGAQRLGLRSIRTALADGRETHAAWLGQADLVVADVPCSGLGIIRKKPDIRYKNPSELSQLPPIQKAILDNVCRYVRPGGVLVYATCTILPEENEDQIAAFLASHPEFEKTPFTLPGIGGCDGAVTLYPQRTGTDGFFICRMRRSEATL